MYNLQDLNELAIPLERLAHGRSVQTQVSAKDRQNYVKPTRVATLARESIGSETSSQGIVPSSTTNSFLNQVLD